MLVIMSEIFFFSINRYKYENFTNSYLTFFFKFSVGFFLNFCFKRDYDLPVISFEIIDVKVKIIFK